MVALPPRPEQQVIDRIYNAIEKQKTQTDLYLGRLGSSSVGNECTRAVWLEWRAYARKSFPGRMHRLFDTGHQQETRIVEDLRNAGFEVWDKRDDGKQFEYTDSTGHLITKVDGVIKGVPDCEKTPHILEIKTHNKNSFSGLVKKGVKDGKPEHYIQIQTSLMLSGMTRALYVALCKDDEQFYVERIKEDKSEQEKLKAKVTKMIEARLKPAGISDNPDAFSCKFCDMKQVCYGETAPLRNCRTCSMCSPGTEGKWVCELNSETLSFDRQRLACEHYDAL